MGKLAMSMIGTRLLRQCSSSWMVVRSPKAKDGRETTNPVSYNPGGKRSWAFPIEEEWSSFDGEVEEIYTVDD